MVKPWDGDYMNDYISTEPVLDPATGLYTYPASEDAGWEEDSTMQTTTEDKAKDLGARINPDPVTWEDFKANAVLQRQALALVMQDSPTILERFTVDEIARIAWNMSARNQHHHEWDAITSIGHLDQHHIREAMAVVYSRHGYATVAERLRDFSKPRGTVPSWDMCTPAERQLIFPWSACEAYRVTTGRNKYVPVEQRYPRLIRLLKWVALLSEPEAVAAIVDYKLGRRYSGEAVNHYGSGPEAEGYPTRYVLQRAIAVRHIVCDYFSRGK